MNGQSLDGSQSAGVVVLGSHRGGTSAVTEALAALGLHAGGSDGLKPGSDANQRGFWEVSALTRFNDRLLLDLGGAWDAPPAPGAGSSGGLEWRAEATELFQRAFTRSPWVWKDPRTSILLAFWRPLLGRRLAAVLPYRHPVEVAQSLHRRDAMPHKLGLALWERYLRAALEGADGLPTLVVPYSSLVESPAEWQNRTAEFLARADLSPASVDSDGWGEVVDVRLHRERHSEGAGMALSEPQAELLRVLDGITGAHSSLSGIELPAETPGIQDLFDVCSHARRVSAAESRARTNADLRTLRKQLDQITESLSWRTTAPLRRALRRRR